MKSLIVAGIGTEVGKTVVSAILTEAHGLDYWKPVQAGNLEDSDTITVRSLVTNPNTIFHPEAYRLQHPLSPHDAAAREGLVLEPKEIRLPASDRGLLVEMAGGLMVPLTNDFLILDLIRQLQLPVVLVSRYYLGSINHTILSAAVLQQAKVPVLGLVFNGTENKASREAIVRFTGLPVLGHVHQEAEINVVMIHRYAEQFRP